MTTRDTSGCYSNCLFICLFLPHINHARAAFVLAFVNFHILKVLEQQFDRTSTDKVNRQDAIQFWFLKLALLQPVAFIVTSTSHSITKFSFYKLFIHVSSTNQKLHILLSTIKQSDEQFGFSRLLGYLPLDITFLACRQSQYYLKGLSHVWKA